MPMEISTDAVREALRPRFGSPLMEQTPLADAVAQVLRGYAPYRDTLADLEKRVESCLFDALYALLGDDMTVFDDQGLPRRIRMRELPDAADDALGALFMSLPVYSVNYQALREYGMLSGSVAALCTLWRHFAAFQTEDETRLQARIIRDRLPESRWRDWLPAEAPRD